MIEPSATATANEKDYEAALEADEESICDDGGSYLSDTTSIASDSSVFAYEYENGRRYHGYRSGKYMLPNDEPEQDRMDMMHHLWCVQLGGRYTLAPVKAETLKHVLDLGTGTGIWCCDMGDEFPGATIQGTDLSAIQPKWVPPNVHFSVDDFEDAWTFPENHFNLIHTRSMYGCIKNWKHVVTEAFKHSAPGGFLEIQDIDLREQLSDDGSLKPDSGAVKYHAKWVEAITKLGLNTPIDEVIDYMKEAGWTNITMTKIKFPISPWPKDKTKKEAGRWLSEICQFGFESYGLKMFMGVLGMEMDEARKLIDGACADAKNLKIHAYCEGYVVVAQKPEC